MEAGEKSRAQQNPRSYVPSPMNSGLGIGAIGLNRQGGLNHASIAQM